MQFDLSEEQQQIKMSVREFAESEIAPHVMEWDESQHFPVELQPKLAELGLMGVIFPEEYGGAGMGYVEYATIIEELSRAVPSQRGLVSTALPLQESLVGRIARALWTLMAAVALVLLVACANVANLFLVRSETRQREVAIRRALGAGRRSLARYFFAESALL